MNNNRRRAGVKRRLVVLAEFALTDVEMADATTLTIPATYEFPGDTIERSAFYLGPVEGRSDAASIGKGLWSDTFGIRCRLDVYGFPTEADAEEAAERALNALDTFLRSLSRLSDPSGSVAEGDDPDSYSVAWVGIGQVDGPTGYMAPGEPAAAGIDLTIEVKTDIKP